jgi:EmrB/QacA subfamily drug resistance transporter
MTALDMRPVHDDTAGLPLPADGTVAELVEPVPPPTAFTHRQILVIFSGLMTGMLLAALDSTIVATALPTIAGDLNGLEHIAWIGTAYLLTTTASTPLYGKLSDIYGRKILFQAAIVIFLAGSMLCGLAQSMLQLIVFRGIQGVGAGGLMVMAFAIIADVVSPRERGRYTGYLGAVFAFAFVVGPLLGGFLVDNLSWRWVFYVNVPVGIVALFVTASVLRLPVVRRDHPIDWLGAALLVSGVSALLLGLVWGGNEYAWGSPVIVGLLVAAAAAIAGFVLWERRVEEPLLPLRLFRERVLSITTILAFIVGAAMYAGLFFLPLFLQVVTGASAAKSGLLLLPLMAGLMLTSVASGRIITRTGRYRLWPIAGLGIAAVGMFLLSTMEAETSRTQSSLYMLILGIGIGMVMQVLVLAAQNAAHFRDLGVVTSTVNFFRSLGGSVGVAALGAVMTATLTSELASRLPADVQAGGSQADLSALLNKPEQIRALPPGIGHAVMASIASGVDAVFLWATPLLVIGFLIAWFLPERPLRDTAAAAEVAVPVEL